jgi:ATP-dependent Lon protease
MVVPLFVGREKSVAALEAAMAGDKDIFLLAQLDPGCDDPDRDDLYDIGVVASVLQLLKLPDGTVRVLVEGQDRARLQRCAPNRARNRRDADRPGRGKSSRSGRAPRFRR